MLRFIDVTVDSEDRVTALEFFSVKYSKVAVLFDSTLLMQWTVKILITLIKSIQLKLMLKL